MEIKTIFREALGWAIALILTPILALIFLEIWISEKIHYRKRR